MKESNFQFVSSSRMKVFENRMLRIFGPKRDKVKGSGDNYVMRSLTICTPHPILFG
jgi:hypothetical protein